MATPEEQQLKKDMVSSGLLYCLAHDIVVGEIEMTRMPMLPTDELELGDYKDDIIDEFGVCEPAFLADVIDMAVARFKACRRRGLDYWGRQADTAYLWS